MTLKEKLASIDTLVFDDPDLLTIMNAWAKSQGCDNYAGYIVRVVEENEADALNWSKLKATESLSWSELASKV